MKLDKNFNFSINNIIECNDIKKIIETHNDNGKEYNSIINNNIEKIKKHFISQYKDIYMKYKYELDNINKFMSNINEKIENKSKELEDINKKLDDHNDSFTKLNEDLKEWFFDDIRFFKIFDSYYKTQRKDCKGEWIDCKSGLSEGEKTIISIIYFMNFYSSSLKNMEKFPILIIDDPINSLDNNNKDKIINYILQKIFNNLQGQIFILSHDKSVLLKVHKYIQSKNFDNKKIFEIEKLNCVSKITEKSIKNIKNDNDTIHIYKELKEFVQNKNLNLNIYDLPRKLLEKVFSICYEDDSNFTQCYNKFFTYRDIIPKYTATDIQELNHNKTDIDLSAELEEKCKFVIEVFEEFTKINYKV